MSGLYENLPWFRGDTYGATTNTSAAYLEGREFIVEDTHYNTGLYVKLRVCRNNSGATLQGGYAVKFNKTAGKGWTDVAGYCTVEGEMTGIVDEFIPPAGVPLSDLFYVVIAGPVLCKTSLVGAFNNSIAVGDYLVALTAATTGATTAGRVGEATTTALTNDTLAQMGGAVLQIFGTAMSAMTTGQTNANILVLAGFPNW